MSEMLQRSFNGTEHDDGVAVALIVDGTPRRLDLIASSVWRLVDGSHRVSDIALQLDIDERQVWAAVDRLADLGVLVRPAPPGGDERVVSITEAPTSRRRMLQLGIAAAAAGAAMMTSRTAAAANPNQESRQKQQSEEREKKAAAENQTKEQRQKSG